MFSNGIIIKFDTGAGHSTGLKTLTMAVQCSEIDSFILYGHVVMSK